MIKIEVRIRSTVDNLAVEHEYRAELPDTATAEQIRAVGTEAERSAKQAIPEPIQEEAKPEPSPTTLDGRPIDLSWRGKVPQQGD